MRRRHRVGLMVLVLLVPFLVIVMAAWVWLAVSESLEANGIEQLEWSGMDLTLTSLAFERFSLVHRAPRSQTKVAAETLSLTIGWQWTGPGVETLDISRLEVDGVQRSQGSDDETDQSTEGEPAHESALPDLDLAGDKPGWLPRRITIRQFDAELPCVAGRCRLHGSASALFGPLVLPATAQIRLRHEGQMLSLETEAGRGSDTGYTAQATLAINDSEHARLVTSWRTSTGHEVPGEGHWQGELTVSRLPQTDWMLTWLGQWLPMPPLNPPPAPEYASINLDWSLVAPLDEPMLAELSGSLSLNASLPQPWPLPGIGHVQGRIQLEALADQGRWSPQTAEANLKLTNLAGWITEIPLPLRPEALNIELNPGDPALFPPKASLLPLQLKLTGRGRSQMELTTGLGVETGRPWRAMFRNLSAKASMPDLKVGSWTLRNPEARFNGQGEADSEKLKLRFGQGSRLKVPHIDGPDAANALWVDGVEAMLDSLELQLVYGAAESDSGLSFKGPLTLDARRFRHPAFATQSWSFSGNMAGNGQSALLEGTLASDAGLPASLELNYGPDSELIMRSRVEVSGEAGSEALGRTLANWPEELVFSQGRLEAVLQLRLVEEGKPEADGQLGLHRLAGLYDRTAWSGLDGTLDLEFGDDRLTLGTEGLTLAQVNPGVALGPVTLSASYQAETDQWEAGQLRVQQATAALLGGRASAIPGKFDLASWPLAVDIELDRIDLGELLSVYPAEGLSGTGRLTGLLPLLVGPDGIRVQGGKVMATAPGGVLKLPAERLQAMARGNQAMGLVADALANFHYSVLNTTIDYKKDGKLTLGLHLKGQNPDVRDGHPLVFNINVEEDIPALLTSLQLSGRVNEAVTEKVRELIRKRESDAD
ncbi:intermembrane phospholipid transport protein YdbH family protein [Marinobacter salicampi]|uniref:intermembrane phospholipid transport protein YdbH family protein n=1 Tax=Marinobacter salicampi TaxID=435907 RepID=UPI001408C157|nr:YdbH domain-containing protein [Marinobacter salicampi]